MKGYNRRLMRLGILALAGCLSAPTMVGAQQMTVEFYHLDAQGNVLVLTDSNGAVVESHDYDVFGQEVSPPGANTQPRRFTGKERDTETGWDYFGARYYGSRIGRFTTTDPVVDVKSALVNPQRWNKYAYGLNNPLRNVDPDGRDSLDLAIGFGQGVGRVALGAAMAFGAAIDSHGIPNPGAAAMMGYEVSQNVQALGYAASNPGAVVDAYVALSTSANGADQRLLGGAIGEGSAVAALTLAPAAKGAPAQVQLNRAAGNAFRDEVAGLLQKARRDVQTEVYKTTPFGRRFIDIEVSQGGKTLGGVETKAGGSRYPASQRAKDWWLKNAEGYPVNVVRDK